MKSQNLQNGPVMCEVWLVLSGRVEAVKKDALYLDQVFGCMGMFTEVCAYVLYT